MKTMQIGELKTHFSEVMEQVKNGEKIVVCYGKNKKNIAVIVPYTEYSRSNTIQLGLLKDRASYQFNKDFEMTSEELFEL